MTTEDHTEIVTSGPRYLSPIMNAAQVRKWRQDYEEIKAAALQEQDYFTVAGPDGKKHRYVRRSGLQILCNFFGILDEITGAERRQGDAGSFAYVIKVRAFHRASGAAAESFGIASSGEARFTKSAKLEHDVQATAETRARKRAQANLIGTYEVMQDEEQPDRTDEVTKAFGADRLKAAEGKTRPTSQ